MACCRSLPVNLAAIEPRVQWGLRWVGPYPRCGRTVARVAGVQARSWLPLIQVAARNINLASSALSLRS
jgi:hypothetical protein